MAAADKAALKNKHLRDVTFCGGPTRGQRKILTSVGYDRTTFGI